MPRKNEELIGVYQSTRFTSQERDFTIGTLQDKTCILGPISDDNPLIPGVRYRFHGWWQDDDRFGRQFKFQTFIAQEPSTVHGVVEYLKKYAPNVGSGIAHRLCDLYGPDAAIAVLKQNPEKVARDCKWLSIEKAKAAASALIQAQEFQETRVRLMDLFVGRGFPGKLVDLCIEKWKVLAPTLVKRDPFRLLTSHMPGCGFLRVDRLYLDLGLPPSRMKRQVMACWHVLHSDMSGSVWYSREEVTRGMAALVSGQKFRPERAIEIARRVGLIVVEERGGREWIADAVAAANEQYVSERLMVLV